MRREIFQKIEIPEGVEAELNGNVLKVRGSEGENVRRLNSRGIDVEKKENEIMIGSKAATKKEKRMINTVSAHIRNMIKGVQEKFEYQLKIAHSHFPMTVDLQGNHAIIKNFLGEKVPRKAKIPEGVEVNIDNNVITITSTNKELAGQAAANFEKSTRISMRDRRIFQDGIFMINKAGKEI